jgi:hypothetical protein
MFSLFLYSGIHILMLLFWVLLFIAGLFAFALWLANRQHKRNNPK